MWHPLAVCLQQSAQAREVAPVGRHEVVVLGCLEDHGKAAEMGIVHEASKWCQAQPALADVLVSVHTAPQIRLRIVQMNGLEAITTQARCEISPGVPITFACSKVIACSENVAGVQADSHAVCSFDLRKDCGEMFEAIPQAGSLAGGGFEQDLHPVIQKGSVQHVQRLCQPVDAVCLARAAVRAWMSDKVRDPQALGTLEFNAKG